MLKKLSWVVLLLAALLVAGYFFVSTPRSTIDALDNPAGINNLHLLDANSTTGFAIYRLGKPSAPDIRALCELDVTQMVVLAGTALDNEIAHQDQCPQLRVVYNHEDDLSPLSAQWLQEFDNWVEAAQTEGRKIAFRCTCGCHRTGRLAAYYQMKYRGLTAADAWDLAQARGKAMYAVDYFSGLQQQIIALQEFIAGKACTQGQYCVQQQSSLPPCEDVLQGCGWQTSARL